MSLASRLLILSVAALAVPALVAAQSPTLPSDTLEANYAPRSVPGPAPELAPSLPSDTLDATAPMVLPDSVSGEMRRDWDQDEGGGQIWKEEGQSDKPRQEAMEMRVGSVEGVGALSPFAPLRVTAPDRASTTPS